MIMTVLKADGPGWLVIVEVVLDGKYKTVQERVPKEPQFDIMMRLLQRILMRMDQVEGAEIQEDQQESNLSFKRATRVAKREMDRRKMKRGIPMSKQIKKEEWEKACTTIRETKEVVIWVKPGKKKLAFQEASYKGMEVVEVPTSLQDVRTNDYVKQALKKRFHLFDGDIELLEGYTQQKKRYKLYLRKTSD